MNDIEKALKDLAKVVKSNNSISKIKITITIKNNKSNKAKDNK